MDLNKRNEICKIKLGIGVNDLTVSPLNVIYLKFLVEELYYITYKCIQTPTLDFDAEVLDMLATYPAEFQSMPELKNVIRRAKDRYLNNDLELAITYLDYPRDVIIFGTYYDDKSIKDIQDEITSYNSSLTRDCLD